MKPGPRTCVLQVMSLWTIFLLGGPCEGQGAGVTFITHGLNGNTDGWVSGMASAIPLYSPATWSDATRYKLYFYLKDGAYELAWQREAGAPPLASTSGEIVVKFDWSQLADGNSYDTYQIASAAVPALLSTNFISELGGHALAELPLQLIGHSRGGSLVCEMSRRLGTNGLWVDHLTTLDPHPLNNDGFTLDALLYSETDAPARTYENVLFHDNYYQDIEFFVYGEAVAGAYIRQLTSLSGGYASWHSDVHLWYQGTIALATPTSDTEASITSVQRDAWWTSYEANGSRAGFYYSRAGGGDRLSPSQPAGVSAVRDGYNQLWDLGAGLSVNRTELTANSGEWPNLLQFSRTEPETVVQGQTIAARLAYQWARPVSSSATVSFYLDNDTNPWNGNETYLAGDSMPETASVKGGPIYLPVNASVEPGSYAVFAKITGGERTRYLYAPGQVRIIASNQPPQLLITKTEASGVQIAIRGVVGQTMVLESAPDLVNWLALATNTLPTETWTYSESVSESARFYRTRLR